MLLPRHLAAAVRTAPPASAPVPPTAVTVPCRRPAPARNLISSRTRQTTAATAASTAAPAVPSPPAPASAAFTRTGRQCAAVAHRSAAAAGTAPSAAVPVLHMAVIVPPAGAPPPLPTPLLSAVPRRGLRLAPLRALHPPLFIPSLVWNTSSPPQLPRRLPSPRFLRNSAATRTPTGCKINERSCIATPCAPLLSAAILGSRMGSVITSLPTPARRRLASSSSHRNDACSPTTTLLFCSLANLSRTSAPA